MRRVIAILLLSFLPFQFVWAAVDGHNAHGTQNIGHHEHTQYGAADIHAAAADTAGASDAGAVTSDADCAHCHCSCAGIFHLMALASDVVPNLPPRPAPEVTGGAHASARPERPQWLSLA